MNPVKVVADNNGNIIHVSENNPEYGWIFVGQETTQIDNNWLRNVIRKARIMGKVKELQEENYFEGQVLPGKIIVKESFTPFNQDNPEKDIKIAGVTGIICRVDDQAIYRQVVYTTNKYLEDELIHHNNSDEIKEVIKVQKNPFSSIKIKIKEEKIEL